MLTTYAFRVQCGARMEGEGAGDRERELSDRVKSVELCGVERYGVIRVQFWHLIQANTAAAA